MLAALLLALGASAARAAGPKAEGTGPSVSANLLPTVVLDPGHGGAQDGAIGPGGEKEKEIVLAIARELRRELEARGAARVLLTRESDSDLSLAARAEQANEAEAELLLSIHCNSLPRGTPRADEIRGVETWFQSPTAASDNAHRIAEQENGEQQPQQELSAELSFILDDLGKTAAQRDSALLARAVHQRLIKGLKLPDRGVQQAPLQVLLKAQMPSVLVEVGFLSNRAEAKRLTTAAWQKRIASALADGIEEYLAKSKALSVAR